MIDFETLKRIAKTKGIHNLGYAEKDYFQELILLGVSRELPELVFKGGTALYKIHGLNRFSQDLDFYGEIGKRTIASLSIYLHDFGYTNEFSIKVVSTGKLITFKIQGFLYQGTSESMAKVQMDVSKKDENVCAVEWHTFFSLYPDIPSFRVGVMNLTEIMAEKVRAFTVRKKARDAYDIWFLLNKGVKMKPRLIRQKLELYDMKFELGVLAEAFKLCSKNWTRELRPLIIDPPGFEVVKDKIMGEIRSLSA
ncbi:nucleotidyl transferase AbiEii/AbiGii toxin family protein [[Eubacterium] cellulosolvens]